MSSFTIGQQLGPLERGPITTRHLVEYAGASLDFNRIHYDEPFARAGGHPSVIVHGMLSMAFLGQLAAQLAGRDARVQALRGRFRAVAYPGDTIIARGEVTAVDANATEIKLSASRSDGTIVIDGSAILVPR